MNVDVYALLGCPWLRHLIHPEGVFGNIIN